MTTQYDKFVDKCCKNFNTFRKIYQKDLKLKNNNNSNLLNSEILELKIDLSTINTTLDRMKKVRTFSYIDSITLKKKIEIHQKMKKNREKKIKYLKNKSQTNRRPQPHRKQNINRNLTCGKTIQEINMIEDDELLEKKDDKYYTDPSITPEEVNMISIPLFVSNRRKWGLPFGILLNYLKLIMDDPRDNISIKYLAYNSIFFIPKKKLIEEFGHDVGSKIKRVQPVNRIIEGPNKEIYLEQIKNTTISILRSKGLDQHIQTCCKPDCKYYNEPFLVSNYKNLECPERHSFCSKCKTIVSNSDEHFCPDSDYDVNEENYIIYMDILSGDSNYCPKCKHFQHRHDGCDKLICINCRTSFCVGCGDKVSNLDYVETHMVAEKNEFRCFKRYLNNCLFGFHSIEDIRNISKIYQYVSNVFPQYHTHTDYDLDKFKSVEGKKIWERFVNNEKNVFKVALTKIHDDNPVIRTNGREIFFDQKNRIAKYLAVLNKDGHEEIHEELVNLIST
jgi:hypothetical protein